MFDLGSTFVGMWKGGTSEGSSIDKRAFRLYLVRSTLIFPFFDLSLDHSYLLGSLSLEMFSRMFSDFNNGNLYRQLDTDYNFNFTLK